jgi:hypothetical protein
MAAVTSTSPPHLSSSPSAATVHNLLRETGARPTFNSEVAVRMNPQPPSPLRTYPEPIPNEAQIPGAQPYFNPRRSQQPSLSQEDQNLANSLSHDMNGHLHGMSPHISNGQAQNFGIGAQSGLPQTPQQPPLPAPTAGQHTGVDPNPDLSYGVHQDRRKRSKVSRACDECRRKKARLVVLLPCLTADG